MQSKQYNVLKRFIFNSVVSSVDNLKMLTLINIPLRINCDDITDRNKLLIREAELKKSNGKT